MSNPILSGKRMTFVFDGADHTFHGKAARKFEFHRGALDETATQTLNRLAIERVNAAEIEGKKLSFAKAFEAAMDENPTLARNHVNAAFNLR